MPLSADQIARFQKQGYTTIADFFTGDEVAAMQAEIERFKRVGLLRNVAMDGNGTTQSSTRQNLQLCPMSPHSALFRALPFDPKVIDVVRSLIGDPILLQLNQVFLKPARHGAGTNWHQDNAYFKIRDPLKGIAMWIAVHNATIANGTLYIIPDRFHENLQHGRDPESDHHLRCYPPEARAVPLELNAGGAAFFCYGMPHCTRANTTDHERAGVALHFVHVDYAPGSLFSDDRYCRPYLTGPKASGGRTEYGTKVAGTWPDEIRSTLAAAPSD